MENWEYLVVVITADTNNTGALEHIGSLWPNWNPAIYMPESLMPELNKYGAEGWQLLSLQPVGLADDGKVSVDASTNNYLAVFKRQKPSVG